MIDRVALVLAAFLAATPAAAHDWAGADAGWIQRNPALKGVNGVHCCGPRDCMAVPANGVRRLADGGVELATPHGAVLIPPRFRALYASRDRGWWVCLAGLGLPGPPTPRCAFAPVGW